MTATPSETHEAALSDERLRECPFCGGRPEWCKGERGDGSPWRYLACENCEAMGPAVAHPATDDEWIAAWNRRTQPSAGEPVGYVSAEGLKLLAEGYTCTAVAPAVADELFNRAIYATPPDQSRVERLESLNDISAERERQKSIEGWTPEHDDQHADGEIALAAACYAAPVPIRCEWPVSDGARSAGEGSAAFPPTAWLDAWPWDAKWWKPSDTRRNLVKAGALILAEIERLDRQALGDRS